VEHWAVSATQSKILTSPRKIWGWAWLSITSWHFNFDWVICCPSAGRAKTMVITTNESPHPESSLLNYRLNFPQHQRRLYLCHQCNHLDYFGIGHGRNLFRIQGSLSWKPAPLKCHRQILKLVICRAGLWSSSSAWAINTRDCHYLFMVTLSKRFERESRMKFPRPHFFDDCITNGISAKSMSMKFQQRDSQKASSF